MYHRLLLLLLLPLVCLSCDSPTNPVYWETVTITGVVTRVDDGTPIQGARVQMYEWLTCLADCGLLGRYEDRIYDTALTDADGRYEVSHYVECFESFGPELRASATGYQEWQSLAHQQLNCNEHQVLDIQLVPVE